MLVWSFELTIKENDLQVPVALLNHPLFHGALLEVVCIKLALIRVALIEMNWSVNGRLTRDIALLIRILLYCGLVR